MRVPFIKMHGLGNDFVVLDARRDTLPAMTGALAARIADRRTGIGCDQLILLEPSESADFRMRIVNADGSEVGACGNATRAVALLHGAPARIETGGGLLAAEPRVARARHAHALAPDHLVLPLEHRGKLLAHAPRLLAVAHLAAARVELVVHEELAAALRERAEAVARLEAERRQAEHHLALLRITPLLGRAAFRRAQALPLHGHLQLVHIPLSALGGHLVDGARAAPRHS